MEPLTAGEVAARLGIKTGMVRRYALALEAVTGVSVPVDPVRGRLYPPAVLELLEAARAHLLAYPGHSVESAIRAVTGEGEGAVTPPARLPGTLSPADLQTTLEAALAHATRPVLTALEEQHARAEALEREVQTLRGQVAALAAEVGATRSTVERVEVMTVAALPSSTSPQARQQRGHWDGKLAAFLLRWLKL